MQVAVVPGGHVAYITNHAYPNFQSKSNLALGILQVMLGGFCIIFQIVGIIVYTPLGIVGIGIWGGTIFVVAGVLGIIASRQKSRCTVISLMVMSIISASVAGGMIINQAISLAVTGSDDDFGGGSSYAIDSLLLIFAVTEMIVAIIQAAFCCGVTCCSTTPPASVIPVAQPYYQPVGVQPYSHPVGAQPYSQPAGAQPNVVYPQGVPQGYYQGPQQYIFNQDQPGPQNNIANAATAPLMAVPEAQAKNENLAQDPSGLPVQGNSSLPPPYE